MTEASLRFVPASSLSLEAFAAAFNEGFVGYHRTLTTDAEKISRLGRLYQHDLHHSLVAYEGERVAGMAVLAIRGAAGWCGGFGVSPAMRGRGVGRRLISALLDGARAAGVRRLSLEVSALNPVARRLYESAGMRVTRDLLLMHRAAEGGPRPAESGPGRLKFEGGALEEAEPRELLAHFARLHVAAPAWQRDLPVMLAGLSRGLRLGTREGTRAYALVSAGADADVYVTDLAAAGAADAEELAAALARQVAGGLGVVNEPEESLFVEPLVASGFAVYERQHEMEIEL